MYEANKSVSYDKCTVFSYLYVTNTFIHVSSRRKQTTGYIQYRQMQTV